MERHKPVFYLKLAILLPLIMVLVVLSGCSENDSGEGVPASLNDQPERVFPAGEAGELPNISAEGMQKLMKETAAEGKVLVVDYWATWCVPCVEMFPAIHGGLKPLVDEGKARLVTVSFDSDTEPYKSRAIEFLRENHALEDAYMAPNSDVQESIVDAVGEDWKDLVVPAILIYDREGNLAAEYLQGGVAKQVVKTATDLTNQPASN
ncbi:TlpA family protein disulfide reductase [Planctomycetota bacterium]|nr:TlpA family protein disulfide reductase [Planctomycetota bacterium]